MKFYRWLGLCCMVSLGGCMWAPGHFLEEKKLSQKSEQAGYKVELEVITPSVVTASFIEQPVLDVPAELLNFKPALYKIGSTDVLYVTVWDHPELTTPSGSQQQIEANGRVVKPDGNLFFPYVGNVRAAGLTVDEFRKVLTDKLAVYIDNPQLDVSVMRYTSQTVYLSGALKNTAPIKLTSTPITLSEALGRAGVDTTAADLSNVKFVRDGKEYLLDVYRLNRDTAYLNQIYLKDQDMIHVNYNDAKKVFLMGEVRNPMALTYRADTVSLSEALASVGGLNQSTANGKSIYVIRGIEDLEAERTAAKIYKLEGQSPASFILANKFQLKPQDIVYVGPTQLSRWARIVDEILPTFQLLNLQTGTALDVKSLD